MSVSHVECRGRAKRFGLTSNGTQRYRCMACGKTFLAMPANPLRAVDGRQLRVGLADAEEIYALFRLGYSVREISKRTHRNHQTVRRYREHIDGIKCGCGEPAGHSGWCDFRLAEAPIRQSYYALMKQGGNKVLSQVRPVEHAVRQMVPKTLPDDIREDLTQDLIVLVLGGKVSLFEAKRDMRKFVRSAWANAPQSKYGPISLDAVLGHDEDLTLMEFVSDDGAHAQQMNDAIEAA